MLTLSPSLIRKQITGAQTLADLDKIKVKGLIPLLKRPLRNSGDYTKLLKEGPAPEVSSDARDNAVKLQGIASQIEKANRPQDLMVDGKPIPREDLQALLTSTNPSDAAAKAKLKGMKQDATYWVKMAPRVQPNTLQRAAPSTELMRAFQATGDTSVSEHQLSAAESRIRTIQSNAEVAAKTKAEEEADALKQTLEAKKAALAQKKSRLARLQALKAKAPQAPSVHR